MPSARLTNATPSAWSLLEQGNQVLQVAPEPVEAPAHDDKPALSGIRDEPARGLGV